MFRTVKPRRSSWTIPPNGRCKLAAKTPRRRITRGLRFRLMASYALFFTVLLVVTATSFRGWLESTLNNQSKDLLDQEWAAVKGYLRIEKRHSHRGAPDTYAPIWFFDRNGEKLRYEIRRDRSDGRYRLVITHPDGTESVEEIDQATDLIERSVRLMNNLRDDGWRVA